MRECAGTVLIALIQSAGMESLALMRIYVWQTMLWEVTQDSGAQDQFPKCIQEAIVFLQLVPVLTQSSDCKDAI